MSYNWIKADTAEGRERLKELLDKGNFVIAKKGFGPNRLAELSVSLCKNEYMVNGKTSPMPFDDLVYLIEDGEFLDPNPVPVCPTDDQICFVASDESNHHDWNDLAFKQPWADGFEAGAKWMRGQMERVQK